jgi:alpha-tubulin suppressor-like RCC1 family protein
MLSVVSRRRRSPRGGALGLGLGVLVGCVRLGTFACDDDAQCVLDGRAGVCADPGYCALPDEACASGHRFHVRGVPDGLAGECVAPLPSADTTSTGTSATAESSAGPTTGDASTTTGTGEPASDTSASSTGDDCGDHPCPCTAALAVGNNHTCVIETDGDVTCWGANNRGQQGSGRSTPASPGHARVTIPGEVLADAIHAGGENVCVRAADTLWCWGRNNNNQLSPGAGDPLPPQPMPVASGLGAVGLGLEHSCVAEPGGPGLECMGGNGNSELGGGGGQPVASALPVALPIDELATGDDHSCVRAGGRVWCWGSDQYGQLGQNAVAGPTPAKTEVSLPSNAVALVAGADHTCAVIGGGAVVRCWGRNNEGQIGDGTTNNRQLPTLLAQPLPAPVVAIDATVDTTCALLTDGDLWCWGGLQGSELGLDIGANTPLTVPQRVPGVDALPEPIVGFGVGNRHLCAHASSGRLWCWGFNSSWQVGPVNQLVVASPLELDLGCPPG